MIAVPKEIKILGDRNLLVASLCYLALPVAIFCLSWVTLWAGIPAVLAILACVVAICSRHSNGGRLPIKRMQLLWMLLILFLWVAIAGIGGYVWQNIWDHAYRNAVFMDLVTYDWPVVRDNRILTYYLGFWIVPAGLVKITGSMAIGWLSQTLWAFMGVVLAVFWFFKYVGRCKLRILLIIILVGTIDIIPNIVMNRDLSGEILENWSRLAYAEWQNTMIYWVYNQSIPALLVCSMVFTVRSSKLTVFLIAIMLLYAPMSVVLLFPLAVYQLAREVAQEPDWRLKLRRLLSPVNILSLLIAFVIGTYILNNNNAQQLGLIIGSMGRKALLISLLSLYLLSIGVWLPYIWRRIKNSYTFWILFLCYLPCPLLTMGQDIDFASRTLVPLTAFLLMEVSRFVTIDWGVTSVRIRVWFIGLVCLSSVSVASELYRIGKNTVILPTSEYRLMDYGSIYNVTKLQNNFLGTYDKWILRKRP